MLMYTYRKESSPVPASGGNPVLICPSSLDRIGSTYRVSDFAGYTCASVERGNVFARWDSYGGHDVQGSWHTGDLLLRDIQVQ